MGAGNPSVVRSPQGLLIASLTPTSLTLSRELGDGGFSQERVDDFGPTNDPAVSLALAADGTMRIAYQKGAEVWLATSMDGGLPDGGGFTVERAVTGFAPSLALDPGGNPHLAYLRFVLDGRQLRNSERASDGGWSESVLEQIDAGFIGMPKLLYDSAGAAHTLYIVDRATVPGGLHHASSGSIEVVPEGALGGGGNGQVDAVFDSAGTLHAVWPQYPFRLMYGRRSAGNWSVIPVSSDNAGHQNNALAVDAMGRAVVAFHTFSALKLSAFNGSSFSVQGLLACESGGIALSLDSTNRLTAVSACGTMSVLTSSGQYPAGHAGRCDQLTTQVCAKACGPCSSSGNCCLSATGFRSCTNRCPTNIGGLACSDATKPEAAFDACLAASAGLVCATPATDGVDLRGTVCDPLFAKP
jgi:hypothetical protein